MCHDDASRPPAPPIVGEVATRERLTITVDDGNVFAASLALPASPARAGVVILPDIRGLHPYYEALAERFAEAGFAAIAIDYFGRTAGLPDGGLRTDDFDYPPHVEQTTNAGLEADITAAIEALRGSTSSALPILTVGFCFGGAHSWRLAATDVDVAGSIGFYGRPERVGEQAREVRKPILMLIAGADAHIDLDAALTLAATMREAGADVTDVVYEGAPHSFFDRSFDAWRGVCDDAWAQILAFADRVLTPSRHE